MEGHMQNGEAALPLMLAGIVVFLVILYAIGVWLGAKGRIIVYRNYNDVMIVALLYVIPSVLLLYVFLGEPTEGAEWIQATILFTTLILTSMVFLLVLIRTWADNGNPFKVFLALYVKIPTAVLFVSHLMSIFQSKKRDQRRRSVLWTLLALPLLYALVHDKGTGRLPQVSRVRL